VGPHRVAEQDCEKQSARQKENPSAHRTTTVYIQRTFRLSCPTMKTGSIRSHRVCCCCCCCCCVGRLRHAARVSDRATCFHRYISTCAGRHRGRVALSSRHMASTLTNEYLEARRLCSSMHVVSKVTPLQMERCAGCCTAVGFSLNEVGGWVVAAPLVRVSHRAAWRG
jgi:hypothetical protein